MKLLISIVTFNRLELLKILVESLYKQSYKNWDLLIINNSSTDDTSTWLQSQKDLIIITQENSGSSGGQFTALKYARDNNYDAVWAMDDDVNPDPGCLGNLLKFYNENEVIAPLRFDNKGMVFLNETMNFNFSNPLKSMWARIINEDSIKNTEVYIEGLTFEGPLIPVKIIKTVGLPDKNFFIFGDDSEYFLRCKMNGVKTKLITSARLNRQLDAPDNKIEFNWKQYYVLRNIIRLDVLYGNFLVRSIRPFIYLMLNLIRCRKVEHFRISFKSFLDGYFYKQSIEK